MSLPSFISEKEKQEGSKIRLSQQHLNTLESCPLHFQQIYLERVRSILGYERQAQIEWGKRFHRLMQQRQLGLSIEPFLDEDLQMKLSIKALEQAIKEPLKNCDRSWHAAEHSRLLYFENYIFTVVYDLLVLRPQTAEIFDWKTYLQPEDQKKLADNWQTRLYLYTLAETTNYLPEQITFTYWFVKLPQSPHKITFAYDSQQHQKNQQDLRNLLTQLTGWLRDYLDRGITFPYCSNCQHNCLTPKETGDLIDVANIAEIPLDFCEI
jgi:hypothetical protein